MSKRRKADPSQFKSLLQESKTQEASSGFSAVEDSTYPVMRTPTEKRVLVYFPRTNVTVVDDVESMDLMQSLLHSYQNGKAHGFIRCLDGLHNEELGYDGTCPACSAVGEVWDLYNQKVDTFANHHNIKLQGDNDDRLKGIKESAGSERVIKNAERYVCFPVAIIEIAGSNPAPDALETMKVEYVFWREQRYLDKIKKVLDNSFPPLPHPAGTFWVWDFNYDTKGKQANARDAARNASFTLLPSTFTEQQAHLIAKAEELAVPFTYEKAVDNIYAMQILFKEDVEAEVNKLMARTRSLLSQIQAGGNAGEILGIVKTQPAQQNALMGVGQPAQGQPQGQPALGAGTPQDLGQAPANLGQAPASLGEAPSTLG